MSENFCRAVPGIPADQVLAAYRHISKDVNLGLLADHSAWEQVCSSFGVQLGREPINRILRTIPKNEEMFQLAHSLRGRFVLGIITDNGAERMALIREDLKLDALFDPIIVSAEVHASKRDGSTAIFDAALARAHCKPGEAVFIDNGRKNLVTPETMGMKTYLFDESSNDIPALLAWLREIGVLGTPSFGN